MNGSCNRQKGVLQSFSKKSGKKKNLPSIFSNCMYVFSGSCGHFTYLVGFSLRNFLLRILPFLGEISQSSFRAVEMVAVQLTTTKTDKFVSRAIYNNLPNLSLFSALRERRMTSYYGWMIKYGSLGKSDPYLIIHP